MTDMNDMNFSASTSDVWNAILAMFPNVLEFQFFFIFGMIHNLEMIIMVIFTNKFVPRYLLTTVHVCEIITAVYLFNHLKTEHVKKCFLIVFTRIVAIYSLALYLDSKGWADRLASYRIISEELVNHGLHKGYAFYWNAYNNEVYSNLQLEMAAVGGDAAVLNGEYRWLVDNDRFEASDGETFLILSASENEQYGQFVAPTFGAPKESFIAGDMYVYVWDYDIVTY